jgi:polysaccharide export outer membrane protein
MTVPWARYLLISLAGLFFALLMTPSSLADDHAYRLGSGDKVRVTVYNEPDLSGDFEVSGQGDLALPLIGQVHVAERSISEVESIVTQKYAKDYLVNPRVNVEVLNYRPFFILGEVKSPGSYPYVSGMTVINAVALAGGYTNRANHDRIYIKRASNPKGTEQEAKEETPVLPGDVIRVAERYF